MVLDISLLNTQHYNVRIKVKWSNPGKGVAPSLLDVVALKREPSGCPRQQFPTLLTYIQILSHNRAYYSFEYIHCQCF